QRFEAALEAVKVTDRLGFIDRGLEPGDRRLRLTRGQVGRVDPPLQQVHLGRERVVPAGVELQGLIRAPGLPDPYDTLAVGGAHVDGSVLGYPAPRLVLRVHRLPPA